MSTSPGRGRVLIIAGSDSGGGAGIQADIKTVTMMGAYAATAVTAITVQNTLGVSAVHPVPLDIVAAQVRAVASDIGIDAIKTGMLGSAEVVSEVADLLQETASPQVVVDPVMVAKGGAALLDGGAVGMVMERLVPLASLLTPNAPEAERLTGLTIKGADDMRRAGCALLEAGAGAVLMKGGHVAGERVVDILMTPAGERTFEAPRLETRHTHGTGCTLASACAAGLALGLPLEEAVERAWTYVQKALAHAPGLGRGHGPLGHNWPLFQ